MTVLVTGGAGFVGSHLGAALRKRGDRVVLLDNFNDYYDPALKRQNVARFADDADAIVVEGDIRDADLVEKLMTQYGINRIAHLAAMAGVRKSIDQAELYLDVNVRGSMVLMEAARRHKIDMFVQASTSSVYGQTKRLPFVEDDNADKPLAPYPATKRSCEVLAHSYYHMFGLNMTCVRFFNVYGPHGRPDMMPLIVMKSITQNEPVTLFNGGALSRDWTYIDDIVDGVVAALDRPLGYEVINLGCGAPLSMTEFVDYFEQLSGKTVQRINVPAPASEPPITYCNNTKARELLGFNPKTPVREGLKRTWEWYVGEIAQVSA